MVRLLFTSQQATVSSALIIQKTRKSKNSHVLASTRPVKLVWSEISIASMSIISIAKDLNGMKLPARRLKTTTLSLLLLGDKMDQRYVSDHCVARSIFSKCV